MSTILIWAARFFPAHRGAIVRMFVVGECVFVALMTLVSFYGLTNQSFLTPLYSIGKLFGTAAALMLAITLMPGILGRFGVFPEIRVISMLFRRHLGIVTYLLAVSHALIMYLLPSLAFGFAPLMQFQWFGVLALVFGLPLFVTSNDVAIRLLGQWWKRLQKLVYIMLLFAALHTTAVGSRSGLLLFGVLVLEVGSKVYRKYLAKK